MTKPSPIRIEPARGLAAHWLLAVSLVAAAAATCVGQPGQANATPEQAPPRQPLVVLDRAVAVVNKHVILSSDLDDEIRLSILDPSRGGQGELTRQLALDQLISRTLIEQQIRQEDLQAVEPSQQEVDERLQQIRKQAPLCVRQNCASDQGWNAFLASHGLSSDRVESYLRYRLEILRFIEQRFRQGIEISQQQIETYYRDTLLPQYAPGEAVPPLTEVAPRIQEILLQQQVNVLFDNWLTNLRQQGDVEILDPQLASAPETPQSNSAPERGDP